MLEFDFNSEFLVLFNEMHLWVFVAFSFVGWVWVLEFGERFYDIIKFVKWLGEQILRDLRKKPIRTPLFILLLWLEK